MRSKSAITLSSRLYYLVKPLIPRSVRMTLRRIPARRQRRIHGEAWPILASAAKHPAGWPGWPLGRRFALVLTHDVEGPEGLERCRQLANLEIEYGFRSSFNFIPEGSYRVPDSLIKWLLENGFEVGVHDLRHNGKLFQSRAGFAKHAMRINQYIRKWGAVGFRSAFMLRNLDWLHDLDIGYDASTFDTDPFEPQPEGTGTIFPFWVTSGTGATEGEAHGSARSRGGYVELPYTLPQDSTLYLVLGERSSAIWKKKLEWIAAQGGMALMNVHPDYINFSPGVKVAHKYDAEVYASFLSHIAESYSGEYWNPLPRDLASWYVSTRPSVPSPSRPANRPLQDKRALVLLYSSYPADPRPRRAAEALVNKGMRVEVLCLKGSDSEAYEEIVEGVHVRRLPLKHRRGGKLGYIGQYLSFIAATFLIVSSRAMRRRYSLVHVHNMPDVLVFSALVPKLLGAKVILDLHDPMPELMRTIFGMGERSMSIRLLKLFEKLSIGFSDAVITVNRACKGIFSRRSCDPRKIAVIMNSPDEGIFQPRPVDAVRSGTGSFVIMYHGSLVERHGLDLAIEALSQIKPEIPGACLRIYGQQTPFLNRVLASVRGTPLEESVEYFGPKTLEEIVRAIEGCDVGIIPNRKSIFTEINTPTRIFEYLSQSRPVIAPRVPGILDYFGADELFYFNLGDSADLARQLIAVWGNRDLVASTVFKGNRVYREHMWSNERKRFIELVSDTISGEPDQSVALMEAI